jgi:hypothetical protein
MTGGEREPAPELPPSLRFPDRPGPLCLWEGLRGHVVTLLFWRAGCVHSRHALADVGALANEFAGRGFAALAIHVTKDAAEADPDRVRGAAHTLAPGVTLALDERHETTRAFAIGALPSLCLIDAQGNVCFRGAGEPRRGRLRGAVLELLGDAGRRGLPESPPFVPLPPRARAGRELWGPLWRPQGLFAAPDGTLWIADTGHHRVLAVDAASGEVRRVCGTGARGAIDGPAGVATFALPSGITGQSSTIVVADTGNHLLRAIDADGNVTTVCGTGERSADKKGGGFGNEQGLCSPAGLCAHDGAIHVAQAGAHQLWQFDLETQCATAWVATGEPLLRDGGGEAAACREPVGLAATPDRLFVADAGNGAVRAVELSHTWLRTLRTGLPRPVALAVHGQRLLVADAWHPAVFTLPLDGGESAMLLGRAQGLREPAALAVHESVLFVADAGADCIFRVDLAAADPAATCRVFTVAGVPEALQPTRATWPVLARRVQAKCLADVAFRFSLPLAAGERIDAAQPVTVDLANESGAVLTLARHGIGDVEDDAIVVRNVAVAEPGDGILRAQLRATIRAGDAATTALRTFRFVIPIAAAADGADAVVVAAPGASPE